MDGELTKFQISKLGTLISAIYINDTDFRSILLKRVLNTFKTSHKNTNIQYGFGGTRPDPEAINYLQERIFILSSKTKSRLEGDLRFELIAGLKNNEPIKEITKRLDTIFSDMMPYQLERIARTEIIDAQNGGRISAYKASDVVEYKMWIAAKGGKGKRVCALCARLNGQIQLLDKPFVDPETGESWQHPVAHPNGRCTTVPLMRLPEKVITIGGQIYSADKVVNKIEILMNLLKSQDKIITKIEVNAESLNKGEKYYEMITVHPKKGQPFKRRQLVGRKEEEKPEEVAPKTGMTPENVKNISTLNELGMSGGMHDMDSYVVEFKDSQRAMYKTTEKGAIIGETSTYDISKILNWDIIPETISGDFGKGEGSCQIWIESGVEPYEGFTDLKYKKVEENHFDDLSKIFVMDMITGNYDRHSGNVMIDGNDKCWAIDNEDWGTAGSADDFIHTLDERAGIHDISAHCPMIRWLDKNLDERQYLKFRENVIENIKSVVENKDKIIDYYNKYKNGDFTIGEDADEKSITLVILCIKDNLDYIEKYLGEHK